jgi:hypothetical protein
LAWRRGFLSDQIGVIDPETGRHTKVSVAAAGKFGYWEEVAAAPPAQLAEAEAYERKHSDH